MAELADASSELSSREVVFGDINRLGLDKHIVELEELGYTVVENAIPKDMVERMREIIIDQTTDKSDSDRPNLDTWDGGKLREGCYLLFEDPVFEKVVQNEYTVALMHYLLGRSMVLSTVYSHVRAKGDPPLPLHTDQWTYRLTIPVEVAVANYALVDYERDKGAFAAVPGSNHLMRRPVTSGNTWHGAYQRKVPGLRLNTAVVYCRSYIQTQEKIREGITQSMLDRNPPSFADLVGVNNFLGFDRNGPDFSKAKSLTSRYD